MIIAFAGRKQSGKTTCAHFLMSLFRKHADNNVNIKIYNFADPLKELCMNILGLTYDQCYGEDKNKNELVNCFLENRRLTAREVLQLVGTDMFRKIQKNVWSDATIRQINKEKPDIAIIADCRFPNEVESIRNADGIVIKLTRNPYNSSHMSETALDPDQYNSSNFDMVIDNNNMSIEQQNNAIYQFLFTKGFLPL